jgi:hypothetical protein
MEDRERKSEEELEGRTRGRWFVLIRHGGVDRRSLGARLRIRGLLRVLACRQRRCSFWLG